METELFVFVNSVKQVFCLDQSLIELKSKMIRSWKNSVCPRAAACSVDTEKQIQFTKGYTHRDLQTAFVRFAIFVKGHHFQKQRITVPGVKTAAHQRNVSAILRLPKADR